MQSKLSLQLAPPWKTKAAWQAANRSIDALIQRYADKLNAAVTLAAMVRAKLESTFSILDNLCIETCPRCPDPCCLHASPWFDYRDLLFLHLNAVAIPVRQPIEALSATCRYFSLSGCTLERISRPWICTWYLCPVQTCNLNIRRFHQSKELSSGFNEIKAVRKEMEERFIRVIA
jgi:hypothetical protein